MDGIRAFACIWVALHNSSLGDIGNCAKQDLYAIMSPVMAGSLGVDLFFVLSGFLITYVLLKELRKYGDIDFELFLKNRFCRIWPMVVVISLIFMLVAADDPGGRPENELTKLLFVNNFFPKEIDHMWSVACEF